MRPQKLLHKLLKGAHKNVPYTDFVRLVEWSGFRLSRQRGSHHFYVHSEVDEVLNLQPFRNEAKPYQIKQYLDLLERYNIELPGDSR